MDTEAKWSQKDVEESNEVSIESEMQSEEDEDSLDDENLPDIFFREYFGKVVRTEKVIKR